MQMKLLAVTQKIDRRDPVLGFFHRWCEKLASCAKTLHVICLQKGECSLPGAVKVFSLGKEKGYARPVYALRFLGLIWALRHDYSAVFVHMNYIYILLGGLFWRTTGKKIYFWYNHQHGGFFASLAGSLADRIFYTSPFSYFARQKKAAAMPAGIDTDLFFPLKQYERQEQTILYAGRISAVKNLDTLIDAALILKSRGVTFMLRIVGAPGPCDEGYMAHMRDRAQKLFDTGVIEFAGPVPNHDLPAVYCRHAVAVNLSPPGLFDKAVLEAMACETPVVVSSQAFAAAVPEHFIFKHNNPQSLADAFQTVFAMTGEERRQYGRLLRAYVLGRHNLDSLVHEITRYCA